jgi:type IV pilus assembly protein PilB
MLAKQYRVPAVDLSKVTVDPKIIKLIPANVATKHHILPLRRVGRMLTVAMTNPTDFSAIDDLKFISKLEIEPVIVGEYTLKKHLEQYYGGTTDDDQMTDLLDSWGEEEVEVIEESDDEDYSALAAEVDSAPVVKFINGLLTDAVMKGVSDIHIETYEKEIRVRYRIDGALQEIMKPPMRMKAALISRIKILSDLNIAERRVPQDGRIKLKMKSKVVDFRVSTLPVIFGEKIVLRILDKGNLTFDLKKFGFEPKAEKDFMWAIDRPYGMVLVTGPTGSGKTTTCASMIDHVNESRRNTIITIEDPIEVLHKDKRAIVSQREVGVDTESYSAGMASVIRQDPDVIYVGELRDEATMEAALVAAETGHLVISTLHTKNSVQTLSRIIAVFEPSEQEMIRVRLSESLQAVVSQRLVAKKEGGRIAAMEVMLMTSTIRDCVRDQDRMDQISDLIEEGREHYGSQTFDQHLGEFVKDGLVDFEVAKAAANNPADFDLKMNMFGSATGGGGAGGGGAGGTQGLADEMTQMMEG